MAYTWSTQERERQIARLTVIIQEFLHIQEESGGCWNDFECKDPAGHLAREIVERRLAWL